MTKINIPQFSHLRNKLVSEKTEETEKIVKTEEIEKIVKTEETEKIVKIEETVKTGKMKILFQNPIEKLKVKKEVDEDNAKEKQFIKVKKKRTIKGMEAKTPEKPRSELPKPDTTTTTTTVTLPKENIGEKVIKEEPKGSILDFLTDPLQNVSSW